MDFVDFSPQANYAERVNAAGGRIFSANICIYRRVAWSARRVVIAVSLTFPERRRYGFFQVAPQISSRC
jgi:hypothetical protein